MANKSVHRPGILPSVWSRTAQQSLARKKKVRDRMVLGICLNTQGEQNSLKAPAKRKYCCRNIAQRPVYTCDFRRALQCKFCRKCKLAAISVRSGCNVCCNFQDIASKLQLVSNFNMFETSAISQRQTALKSRLV